MGGEGRGAERMNPLVTLLIPTFRNHPTFLQCFLSLVKYTEYPYKVLVLNNDPTPGGKAIYDTLVKETDFDDIEVLHLGTNLGWMGAINAGMKRVDTPQVCIMNDDLLFVPGHKAFWRVLARHLGGEVAAVGPSSNFVTGPQSLFHLETPPAFPVKFLIGFCMMLRTDLFRQVGLLDEMLPGGDDFDLSIRLRQLGYTLVAEKDAYVHHVGSVTGRQVWGQHWDSLQHRDDTNNALIRKHGLKVWYDTLDYQPFSKASAPPGLQAALSEEDDWWRAVLPKEQRGFNVGCGDSVLEGVPGLDLSKPGERSAGGRKFTGAEPDVTGDASALPLQDASLDFLAARHVFEHLVDPVAALREWQRVLKPGGLLLVSCPDYDGIDTMLIDYTHLHAYTLPSLLNLLSVVGFEAEDFRTFAVGSFGVMARNSRCRA